MSIRFDASGDYLSLAYGATPGLAITSFTLCGWSYVVSDRGNVEQSITATGNPGVTADLYYGWDDGANVAFAGSYVTGGTAYVFPSRPAVGEWFFWYMRCAGGGGSDLQIGWRRPADSAWTQGTAGRDTGATFTNRTLTLGRDAFGAWLDGRQGALYVYGSSFSDAQLLSQMNQRAPVGAPWAWFPMNYATLGSNYLDQSGNGRNLIGNGTLTVEDNDPAPNSPAAQTLLPGLFTNTQTFYGPTATVGSVTLSPGMLTNAQAFYPATVTQSGATQNLLPGLYTNSQTFFPATVTQAGGTQTLSSSLFTNANTFFVANITGGQSRVPVYGGGGDYHTFIPKGREREVERIIQLLAPKRKARKPKKARIKEALAIVSSQLEQASQTEMQGIVEAAAQQFELRGDMRQSQAEQAEMRRQIVMGLMAQADALQEDEDIELLLLTA